MKLLSLRAGNEAPFTESLPKGSKGLSRLPKTADDQLLASRGLRKQIMPKLPSLGGQSNLRIEEFPYQDYPSEDAGLGAYKNHFAQSLLAAGLHHHTFKVWDVSRWKRFVRVDIGGEVYVGSPGDLMVTLAEVENPSKQDNLLSVEVKQNKMALNIWRIKNLPGPSLIGLAEPQTFEVEDHLGQAVAEVLGTTERAMGYLTDGITSCLLKREGEKLLSCWKNVPLTKAFMYLAQHLNSSSAVPVDASARPQVTEDRSPDRQKEVLQKARDVYETLQIDWEEELDRNLPDEE